MLGFTNTLLEVIQKQKPSHIAIAFDTSAPTFRHKEYKEYKANRDETPEDIKAGVPIVKDIIRAFNIPILELDGYEADDIIGTVAKKAAREGYEVFMMTPDKDFGQLVEDHIFLYKPAFMGNAVDVQGVPEVCNKWDIENVDQVVDMLGLMGDSVDNIPGIPGIGPKTAAKLLKQFGSVEELVKNTDQLKGKQKENVENFADQGLLSKRLARINIDVPVSFSFDDLEYDGPDKDKIQPLFEDLEFRTLARRVLGESDAPAQSSGGSNGQLSMFSGAAAEEDTEAAEKRDLTSVEHDYHLVESAEDMKSLAEYLKKQSSFCFDVETNSIDAVEALLVGIAFSYYSGEAFYVPVPLNINGAKEILDVFKDVLEDANIEKLGHNIKYDILSLKKYDIHVDGPLYDTMLAHYLVEPRNSSHDG